MFEVATIYIHLIFLVFNKLTHRLLRWCLALPRLVFTSLTHSVIHCGLALMNIPAVRPLIFDTKPSGERIKLGVAILTRFPITERAIAPQADQLDKLQASLKGATLFERILGEMTASTVLRWLDEISGSLSPSVTTQLFLVYRMNYTSAFSLSGWFSVIPNHLLAQSIPSLLSTEVQVSFTYFPNYPSARMRFFLPSSYGFLLRSMPNNTYCLTLHRVSALLHSCLEASYFSTYHIEKISCQFICWAINPKTTAWPVRSEFRRF